MPHFDENDMALLEAIGKKALEADNEFFQAEEVQKCATAAGLEGQVLLDALDMLDRYGLIEAPTGFGPVGVRHAKLTSAGLGTYLDNYASDFPAREAAVRAKLAENRHGQVGSRALALELGVPQILVEYIFEDYEGQGMLKTSSRTAGPTGQMRAFDISPEVGRL